MHSCRADQLDTAEHSYRINWDLREDEWDRWSWGIDRAGSRPVVEAAVRYGREQAPPK